jgi:hypothetical protein
MPLRPANPPFDLPHKIIVRADFKPATSENLIFFIFSVQPADNSPFCYFTQGMQLDRATDAERLTLSSRALQTRRPGNTATVAGSGSVP